MSFWDDNYFVEEFLCLELREGSITIAVIGIIYGLIGFLMVLSFIINHEEWRILYANKTDELVYIMFIFVIISGLFVISLVLLIGVLRAQEILVRLYLWGALIHLCLDWLVTICMCLYCVCVHSCFRNNPAGTVVGFVLLTVLYTLLWGYFIVAANGYRMEL